MARLALALSILLIAGLFVRGDELSDFRAREQIVAQKWTREVAAALDTSRQLERTDPASARESVQAALAQLRTAPGLSDTLRRELSRRLETRLGEISRSRPVAAAPPVSGVRPSSVAPPSRPTTATPPAGGLTEASRAFIDKQKGQLTRFGEIRQDRATGFSGAISGVQTSVVPPNDAPLAVAPDHKDIMARRQPKLNAKEEAVMKALGTTLSAEFSGMNFGQVLQYITDKAGLMIIPDGASLKEAGVEYDDPVNFKLSARVPVRTILKKVLGDRGLSYVVQEGGISVVTTQKARESTVVRIYPINDLVTPIQPQPQFIYNPLVGGFVPAPPGLLPTPNRIAGQAIADMIRTSVDPSYWAPTGPGSVVFNEATGALIVRASAEIHFMIGGSLYSR